MSSANAFSVTLCLIASSERSAVYKIKSMEPSTQHVMVIVVDVIAAYTTQKVLPVRYDLNQDNASPLIQKPCSRVSVVTSHGKSCRMHSRDPINTQFRFIRC